jgi:hypothetical protein
MNIGFIHLSINYYLLTKGHNKAITFQCSENSEKITVAYSCLQESTIKFPDKKDKYFSLHKNNKPSGIIAQENTLYYEK